MPRLDRYDSGPPTPPVITGPVLLGAAGGEQSRLTAPVAKVLAAIDADVSTAMDEDLRTAAGVLEGRKVARGVRALVVPGSEQVKAQARSEGLDRIFTESGAEWRDSGCSMCLAMNPDKLRPAQRCASTSNRNFEGRQGPGGRTHLVSPAMAAAAAVSGHFVDVRQLLDQSPTQGA